VALCSQNCHSLLFVILKIVRFAFVTTHLLSIYLSAWVLDSAGPRGCLAVESNIPDGFQVHGDCVGEHEFWRTSAAKSSCVISWHCSYSGCLSLSLLCLDVSVAVDLQCDDCSAADLRLATRLSVIKYSEVLSVSSVVEVRQLRRHLSRRCHRLHRHSRPVLNYLPSDILLSWNAQEHFSVQTGSSHQHQSPHFTCTLQRGNEQ